jgi:Transcription factor AFT
MPAHLCPALDRAITAIPAPWLLPPKSGEVFENKTECMKRLQAFALAQGFAVVTTKSDNQRVIFRCIHHGGKIVGKRQRNGFDQQKECLWMCYCSFKPLKRGEERRFWQLTVKELLHLSTEGGKYPIYTNPFY